MRRARRDALSDPLLEYGEGTALVVTELVASAALDPSIDGGIANLRTTDAVWASW